MELFSKFLRSYSYKLSSGNIILWLITILSIILSICYTVRLFRNLGGKK